MYRSVLVCSLIVGCSRDPQPAASLVSEDSSAAVDSTTADTKPGDAYSFEIGGDGGDAVAEVDLSEECPDPDYPPRTDGCPCNEGNSKYCFLGNEGKVCVYGPFCPGAAARRYVCTRHEEFEKPTRWIWQPCPADCDSGECLPTFGDAGVDG